MQNCPPELQTLSTFFWQTTSSSPPPLFALPEALTHVWSGSEAQTLLKAGKEKEREGKARENENEIGSGSFPKWEER